MPVKPFTIKREVTPSTPPKAQYAKQNWPATPITPMFQMQPTPFSPSALPTKAHVTYQSLYQAPLKGVSKEKASTGPSFDQLCPHIPHPNELHEPSSSYPPVKKWYVITVSQEVGIFSSWLDITAHICGVPELAHISCPTYAQAVAEYHKQFNCSNVQIVLVPGSQKVNEVKIVVQVEMTTFEDEYEGFTYDQDVAQAVYEAEVYAKAEKAYRDVLLSHGFKVPK